MSTLTRKTPAFPKPRKSMRRTPLKKRSKAKAAWVRKYSAALHARKEEQIAERGATFCEKCQKPGEVEGHHPGGQIGGRIMVFKLIDRQCHEWCHAHPNEARRLGYLILESKGEA